MKSFYDENMKIGIPVIIDRGTDVILEDDFYYFNENKICYVKEGVNLKGKRKWMDLWKEMINYNSKKKN